MGKCKSKYLAGYVAMLMATAIGLAIWTSSGRFIGECRAAGSIRGSIGDSIGDVKTIDTDDAILAADNEVPVDLSELKSLEQKFQSVARKVAPSVVAISASTTIVDSNEAIRNDHLNHERLESLLEHTTRIVGTGFIIDADGYILTNEHVVGETEGIWITTDDRKVYPAILVGSDPRSDLAVLKIVGKDFTPVKFASYASVQRGQWSIALGNPYGMAAEGEEAMSVGIISALDRSLQKLSKKENRLYTNLLQTTAQINPGNSGGPLFNLNGEVIGLNTAVILPDKRTNGIGFAMPITARFLHTVSELKQGNEIVYGYMGVMVTTATEHDRKQAHMTESVGVRIDAIESDSPAGESGELHDGDLIVQVNGEIIRDSDQFTRVVGYADIAQPAKIALFRNGKPMKTEVKLRQRILQTAGVTKDRHRFRWQGMLLGSVPQNWDENAIAVKSSNTKAPAKKSEVEKPHGVLVIGISENSPYRKENIKPGDIITSLAGKAVNDIVELQKILNQTPIEKCTIGLAGRVKVVALVE